MRDLLLLQRGKCQIKPSKSLLYQLSMLSQSASHLSILEQASSTMPLAVSRWAEGCSARSCSESRTALTITYSSDAATKRASVGCANGCRSRTSRAPRIVASPRIIGGLRIGIFEGFRLSCVGSHPPPCS